jgi:hypothetical protein
MVRRPPVPVKSKFRVKVPEGVIQELPGTFLGFASSCEIVSGSEIKPFILYECQETLAQLLELHQYHCWYKTRQLGVSELIICWMLYRALKSRAYTGVCLSIGQKESSKLGDRAKGMWRASWEYQGSQRLKSRDGGNIYFFPSTENAARSLSSVTDLYYDEAGFIENWSSIYGSSTPAQAMAGEDAHRLIVTTMPEDGELNPTWQILASDAPPGIDVDTELERVRITGFSHWIDTSGWCKALIHWKAHPIYTLLGDYLDYVKKKEKLPDHILRREYNLEKPESGGSLFNMEAVKRQALGRWQLPVPGRKYLAAIDTNYGGGDYYVLGILDITGIPTLVAQIRQRQETNLSNRERSVALIRQYKPVLIAVEVTGGGQLVYEALIEELPDYQIEPVKTTNSSKPVLTDRVALIIEEGGLTYPPDWEFCSAHKGDDGTLVPAEAQTFSVLTRSASTGHHDDTVMMLAVGLAVLGEAQKLSANQYAPVPEYWEKSTPEVRRIFS